MERGSVSTVSSKEKNMAVTKLINFQCVYDVPLELEYVAFNLDGTLIGFRNAPVRDMERGEWVDCVDGSCGEIVPYTRWDTSCRPVAELHEHKSPGTRKAEEAIRNTKVLREKNILKREQNTGKVKK